MGSISDYNVVEKRVVKPGEIHWKLSYLNPVEKFLHKWDWLTIVAYCCYKRKLIVGRSSAKITNDVE